jgi:Protein of unknown function (DUF2924)/Protein of unknown function (DUF3489)
MPRSVAATDLSEPQVDINDRENASELAPAPEMRVAKGAWTRRPTSRKASRSQKQRHSATAGSKQDLVLTLLRRQSGVGIDDIVSKTHWQPHTDRELTSVLARPRPQPGFSSGLVVVQKPKFGHTNRRSVVDRSHHHSAVRRGDELSPNSTPSTKSAGLRLPASALDELRREWRRLHHCEPPRLSRDLLVRGIGYRLQELQHGSLSTSTRRKLKTLARMFRTEGRVAPNPGLSLKVGARLVREWHGRTHTITVTEDGFEYAGATYPSLTKIAHKITGTHWSGPRFFGLMRSGAYPTNNGGDNG